MEMNQPTMHINEFGSLLAMPGYQIYEYQLILVLPEALKEKIRKQKQQFYTRFNLPQASTAGIFLPLVKFRQRQLLEQKVRFALNQLITGWRPFPVNLKDYGFQPTHSVYIPVTSRNKLQEAVKSLRTINHLLKLDKDQTAFYPADHQVTIASRLRPGVYEQASQEYAHRHFTGQFMADAALLLKRKMGEPYWQIAQRYEFRDLPVGAVQASLFQV